MVFDPWARKQGFTVIHIMKHSNLQEFSLLL